MSQSHHITTGASVGGSLWWIVDAVRAHGPSWQIVPPLLFGLTALVGAVRSYLNDAQARRHAEQEHAARLVAVPFRPRVSRHPHDP